MKPMALSKTLLFFCIPGVVIFLLFRLVYKILVSQGIPIYWATYICLWMPLILMVLAILFHFLNSKQKIEDYFWIKKLSMKALLIVAAGFIVTQLCEALLSFTRPVIAAWPGFGVPAFYPDMFRPDLEIAIPVQSLLGMDIPGNICALLFFILWVFTNIFCEELLWRGFALPRMERAFGKWAWLVNGLLWNIAIHFFFRFSFITLLPISLIVPYLSQRYKSLWPGVIIHGTGNLLIFVILIPSYFSSL